MQATSRLGHLFLTGPTLLLVMLYGEKATGTQVRTFELVHQVGGLFCAMITLHLP